MKEAGSGGSGPLAVVLFQLGGPDSPEAIEPFLYNLFSDPDIIDFPFSRLARPVLARLIAARRAKRVAEHYARIGGRSPLGELTGRQAAALEAELAQRRPARVFVAMRYWHPLTEEAARQVAKGDFRELVLLPLYPQYSRTTTGSSLNEWGRKFSPHRASLSVRVVRDFHDHPLYLEALVEKINLGLERFETARGGAPAKPREASPQGRGAAPTSRPEALAGGPGEPPVHLVFSAHGVPLSVIEAGDPYQAQLEATVRLAMERGGWPNPHWLCYQSRVGPGRWLGPSLEETLRRLASEGARSVLVVPVSFVSDHIETLHEISLEARELASRLGLGRFEVMPALNDSPAFIRALADLVLGSRARPL